MDKSNFIHITNSIKDDVKFQLYINEQESNQITISDGDVTQYSNGKYTEVSLKYQRNGKFYESKSTDNSDLGIKKLLDEAYRIAELNSIKEYYFYKGGEIYSIKDYAFDEENIYRQALEAIRVINKKEGEKINAIINIEYGINKISIFNSIGGIGIWQIPYMQANAQIYINNGYNTSFATKSFSTLDANNADMIDIVDSAHKEAEAQQIESKHIEQFVGPVVFSNAAVAHIATSLILSISTPHISANKSFNKDLEKDKTVGSEKLTIYEDPEMKGSIYSRPFDDQLVPTFKKALVENGTVKTYLNDLKSAIKTDVRPTGNAFKIHDSIDGMQYAGIFITNAIVSNGQTNPEELIRNLEKGVYIHSINYPNPLNGKFTESFRGYYIENGKIKYLIKNGFIKSNLTDILNNISDCGSELKRLSQIMAPSILAEDITISSL